MALCFALGDTARFFPFVIFLAPVVLTTFLGGVRPGLLAAILAGVAAKYLLIEPVGSFALAWPTSYLAMGFFTLTVGIDIAIIHGITIGFTRAERAERELLRLNGELERRVAERTAALESEMAERRSAEGQVRQMQKMEAVGQLGAASLTINKHTGGGDWLYRHGAPPSWLHNGLYTQRCGLQRNAGPRRGLPA